MKHIILLLVVGAFAATAQAAYLMWQVDAGDVGSFNADSVRIAYSSDEGKTATGYLTLQDVDDDGSFQSLGTTVKLSGESGTGTPMLYADVSTYTGEGYSFFIELINYDAASEPQYKAVAVSESETYANLTAKGFTGDSLIPTVPTSVWHGGSFSAVPEPTSAMLVMFGMGLLALKRKRV